MLGLGDWMLEQVDVGAEAGGCGCWRLEFGNFAANGICIKIVRDQESRLVGLVGKSFEKNPYL